MQAPKRGVGGALHLHQVDGPPTQIASTVRERLTPLADSTSSQENSLRDLIRRSPN